MRKNGGRATGKGAGRGWLSLRLLHHDRRGKPVVSFAYTTLDAAGAAATQVRAAIEHAIEARAHPQAEGDRWR
jgi:hypothetical protein